MKAHYERKEQKIEEIKSLRAKQPDLDAIELAKAPQSKRGNAEQVAESMIKRQEQIKRKWDRKKVMQASQQDKELPFRPKTNKFSGKLRDQDASYQQWLEENAPFAIN